MCYPQLEAFEPYTMHDQVDIIMTFGPHTYQVLGKMFPHMGLIMNAPSSMLNLRFTNNLHTNHDVWSL